MNDIAASVSVQAVPERRWLIPLALLAVYVIWGSTYLGIRIGLTGFPPFAMAAIRFFVAGIAMYAWLRLRGAPSPTRRQWRNAAITGVLLLLFGNGLVCFAEQSVASGVAAVAIASEPLFVALVLFAYRERPSRAEVAGLVVGFLGVLVLNSGGAMRAAPWAAVALLVATAAWAFGSIWSRRQDMPEGPMNVAAQMLCAAPALALTAWLTGERVPAHPPAASIMALAYLAVFGSIIGFSAYLFLVRHARPTLTASYAYVNPPVAVLLGALIAGERVGAAELAGMVVILVGVAIITLAHTGRSKPRPTGTE
ncbi:MAG: putative inner membrane transporter YedA [Rhodanobacteraceae bacterium]|jgi:drug/metabolite transporter (DMT)-like permease|nr:MAG: putative inner membrane transporter YedA [Rhodanobacteraceae bacterium]